MRDFNSPKFVKFLYNHNPFYLISAAVILYGFRSATEDASFASNPWFLASMFAGYTTLLSITAWIIVRFGRVWDDARSIFMVLLLLFMALSASLDGLFATDPTTATALAIAGFLFAMAITETLIWSLRIRFGLFFRGPLYGMFAVSFFYPSLFALQKQYWPEGDYRFIILAFPFVVAGAILTLVPAIKRSKSYIAKNGTPWNWPLYPWSVFALAIVGLVGRAVMLGLSFDPSPENGMLGTWIFVPIFLSVMWLVFEIGCTEENEDLQILSMFLMPLSLALAVSWPAFPNTAFYDQISLDVGSPVWLTLLVLVGIYFVAWIENVEGAGFFLAMSLVAASVLKQDGSFASEFAELQTWSCIGLGAWSVASTKRIRSCASWLLSCSCWSIAMSNRLTPWLSQNIEAFAPLSGHEAAIALNLTLLCACVLVCTFSTRFSAQLKVVLAFVLPCLASLAAIVSLFRSDVGIAAIIYGATLATAGFCIFAKIRSRLHLSAAVISLGASMFATIPLLEVSTTEKDFRLATFLGVGFACFLCGLLVSAIKAGWMQKFNSGIQKQLDELREAFPARQHAIQAE